MAWRKAALVFCVACGLISPALGQTYADGDAAYEAGDYEKAKQILIPLADAGNAAAMTLIGLMHDFGKGYPKNPTQACDWYEKAAQIGDEAAIDNLGLCYELGSGRPQDIHRAMTYYEITARAGSVDSQIDLMKYYQPTDVKKAQYWGQKAVDQGSVLARVAMWGFGIPHTGPQATLPEIACVYVMIGLFYEGRHYCD